MKCTFPYQKVTTPGTTIISPNFPRNYSNDIDCELSIMFESTQRVGVNFDLFDIETGCADWLKIFDGNSSSASLLRSKYCGDSRLGYVESSGSSMHLNFHSDSTVTKSGFKLNTYVIGMK